MYYYLYYLHDVNFSEKTKIPIGYQRSDLRREGNGLYISLWQRRREDYKMSRKIHVREGKEVITVFFSRWINYKVVCCFHEDSEKTLPLCFALFFLRIECQGTFMEAPKHEKEKEKKKKDSPASWCTWLFSWKVWRWNEQMAKTRTHSVLVSSPNKTVEPDPGGWLTKTGQKSAKELLWGSRPGQAQTQRAKKEETAKKEEPGILEALKELASRPVCVSAHTVPLG